MGYDVSYHPVDTGLIVNVALPFVLNGAPIPELVESDAIRIALNRFRANAWGLGVARLSRELSASPQPPQPSGFLERLFGAKNKQDGASEAFEFEADLYVWGRPFFITDDHPATVSARVDEFLACRDGPALTPSPST